MGIGIAFLRKRENGTWEGDYERRGRWEFSAFHELVFSLKSPSPYFLSFREEDYDVEIDDRPPPYPAQVSERLAEDLKGWYEDVGLKLLEALRQLPIDQVASYVQPLKTLVEQRLVERYAIVISY